MNAGLLKTSAIAIGVLCGAALLGVWVGELSAPKEGRLLREDIARRQLEAETVAAEPIDRDAPPVFFLAGTPKDGDWSLVHEEISMAAAREVHQFILPAALSWPGETGPPKLEPFLEALEADPRAAFYLDLDFNPPETWLQNNIPAARTQDGKPLVYPSLASPDWLRAAGEASIKLYKAFEMAGLEERVLGVVLGGLREGRWRHPDGIDDSPVNLAAFRDWLRGRYGNEEALRAAWGLEELTFAAAGFPPTLPDGGASVFCTLPDEQCLADFMAYTAWQTANAIDALARHWKSLTGPAWRVLVNYGHGLELPRNTAGHGALGLLLEGDVDGFLSPVSSADRGLGGVGGMMGPVASALLHGKQWILIDDARTGLAKDPATGRPVRMKGLNRRDVFNVQRRNFSLAMTQGMGIAWADPLGQGALCDEAQWTELEAMRAIFETAWADPARGGGTPGLLVVYDEEARNYVKNARRAHTALLLQTRDAVLRTGVAARFCLLEDFLSGAAPSAPAYLFLNLFLLDTETRQAIHARLAREKATALWRYAPGYFGDDLSGAEAISATVAMTVRAAGAGAKAGSRYALEGTWITVGGVIGTQEAWDPLYYVDDENADVLANYIDGGKGSVALRQPEAGWTSVFIAEPGITPALLREIFHILELPLYPAAAGALRFDAFYAGNGLLALHAGSVGERAIQLPEASDVRDLFDDSAGWLQTEAFMLPMNTGETRLLRVTPKR